MAYDPVGETDSFAFIVHSVGNRLMREVLDKMPRCPKCQMTLDIMEVNTKNCNQVDGNWKSLIFCRRDIDCGYLNLNGMTVLQLLKSFDFSDFTIGLYKEMKKHNKDEEKFNVSQAPCRGCGKNDGESLELKE